MTALSFLAQSSDTQTGNPLLSLLPLLLLFGVFYFLMIRPQRMRQQQQRRLLNQLEVGDDVLTIAGMYGTVVDIDEDDDTVTLEVAPGTRIRMVRRAISQRLTEDENDDHDTDADGDSPDEESEPRP